MQESLGTLKSLIRKLSCLGMTISLTYLNGHWLPAESSYSIQYTDQ